MFADEDLLPISALQHLQYCERQCALIHIEQVWTENVFTAKGRVMHDRAHGKGHETRGDVRTAFGLRLSSLRLGLTGQADVVEFHWQDDGAWRPFPVEYKRGHPKANDCDRVQLCAQALCLEEMTGVPVEAGALYYGETRHRCDVPFDNDLRAKTEALCSRLHAFMDAGTTPAAAYEKGKCGACSLLDACLPQSAGGGKSARKWLARQLEEICSALPPEGEMAMTLDERHSTHGTIPSVASRASVKPFTEPHHEETP
jgi:CRISPR-associated exonuclease Cas4